MVVAMAASPRRDGVLARDRKSCLRGTRLQRRPRAPCFSRSFSHYEKSRHNNLQMIFDRSHIRERGEAWINATHESSGNVGSCMPSSRKALGSHQWQAIQVLYNVVVTPSRQSKRGEELTLSVSQVLRGARTKQQERRPDL